MNTQGFKDRIMGMLQKLWGGVASGVQGAVRGLTVAPQEKMLSPVPEETPTPQPPSPTPTPTQPQVTAEDILRGLMAFSRQAGANVPLATQAATLAEAGNKLPDPYMPAVLSMKETRSGLDLLNRYASENPGLNNATNIMYGGKLIDYPDYRTHFLGGGTWGPGGAPQKGLVGTLLGGQYNDYLNSGNLEDFFNVYSNPSVGNPPMNQQIADYEYLRSLFGE